MKFRSVLIAGTLTLFGGLGFSVAIAQSESESGSAEETTCNLHELENSFETENYWVYICREEDKLFYTRFGKTSAGKWVRLPATRTPDGRYTARDVDTTHIVDSERLEVWQDGRRIVAEPVINAYLESTPDLSEIPEAALQGCRQRVLTELDTDEDNILITNAQALGGIYSVYWRLKDGALKGSCQVESNGSVIAFSSGSS